MKPKARLMQSSPEWADASKKRAVASCHTCASRPSIVRRMSSSMKATYLGEGFDHADPSQQ